MSGNEFYDYIVANFNLGGAAFRLVRNIIDYVDEQDFTENEDGSNALWKLLGGAFGIEYDEVMSCDFIDFEEVD